MKSIFKISVLTPAAVLMFLADMPPEMPAPYVQLVPEAQAILGVWRRHARRWAVVGTAVVASDAAVAAEHSQQAAAAQQQQAAASKQAAAVAQQPAAAPPPPPAATATGQTLPVGTVVPSLPGKCTSTPVGGVEYYYCGGNFYRAVFQGNSLVYVTAQPK